MRIKRQVAQGHRLPVLLIASLLLVNAVSPAAQQTAYVSASSADTCQDPGQPFGCTRGLISVINVATNQIQSSLDVWRGAAAGYLTFRAVLADPTGRRLYAVLVTAGSSHPPAPSFTVIQVFDAQTLARLTEFTVAGVASSCLLSRDGARLLCARNVIVSDVVVIDTATNLVTAAIPAVFPTAVALSPSGDSLFVAQGDNQVSVHDGATHALRATVPLPGTALALAVTPDGSHLYAALNDRSIADIDTVTNTVAGLIAGVATGSNLPLDVTFARGNAFVATGGGTGVPAVAVVDVASRTIVTRIPVQNPQEIATSLDESPVFVTREFGLTVIDAGTYQVTASTPLPGGPGRLALSPPPQIGNIVIDAPGAGARVQQPFLFGGWAVDVSGTTAGPGIDLVHVWAVPDGGGNPVFLGAADYGVPRPDVAALFGTSYLNAGYQMTVRGLTPGAYTLTAYGHSTRTGTFSVARQVPITVASSLQMAIDAPAAGAEVPGSFILAGWALDSAALAGSGIDAVHVWAYPFSGAAPTFAGAATLGLVRPDVAAEFGPQFAAAGYGLAVDNLLPGSYTLVVYARQASTATFAAEHAVRVTVTTPTPYIVIDLPSADAVLSGSVRVAGWAIESGAATGTGVDAVHVWAYPSAGGAPILIGVAPYGGARPDVGAVFGGRYTPSGFDVLGSLPSGGYEIVAFAHSTTTNSFRGVRVVRGTVE